MSSSKDPLFERYPLRGTVTLSTGVVPVPYHIYDGFGALVGGTANAENVRHMLAGQRVQPLLNTEGRALAAIWLCAFNEASLGPHHELQVSFFVAREPLPPIPASTYALLAAMLALPGMEMYCHALWNDTAPVVAYNREHLGLSAEEMSGEMALHGDTLQASFADCSERPLIDAALHRAGKASLGAAWAMLRLVGPRRLSAVSRQPWVSMMVVNPISRERPGNQRAQAFVHNTRNVIRSFDARTDTLNLSVADYTDLDFRPGFVQHMTGFHFVYLDPQPVE
jgi:hypothetical protein